MTYIKKGNLILRCQRERRKQTTSMEISDKSELNPKCIAAVIPKQGRNKKKMATIQTQARTTMT